MTLPHDITIYKFALKSHLTELLKQIPLFFLKVIIAFIAILGCLWPRQDSKLEITKPVKNLLNEQT